MSRNRTSSQGFAGGNTKGGRAGATTARLRHTWIMAVFDAIEPVFGPDPGLIRLKVATRAALSAALALTILLLATGAASHDAVAAVALGFMTATISNMAVRDEERVQQGLTLALLALPALGAIALSSFLATWPWLAEAGFVVVATAAASAGALGPRGMALGMVAFIVYFIGAITRPSLGAMPLLALGIGVGLGASALMRFAVLPDDRAATMRHVAWHLRRRVARILSEAVRMLKTEPSGGRSRNAMDQELSRLRDAFQVADQQVREMNGAHEAREMGIRILAVELAAERVLRIAGGGRAEDVEGNSARLNALEHGLRSARLPPPGSRSAPSEAPERYRRAPLAAAIDTLESALAGLEQECP